MRIDIAYGRAHVGLDIPEGRLVPGTRLEEITATTDPTAIMAAALEKPVNFPALRHALTPDDHVAIVVDERLPQVAELIACVLDHLSLARIAPEAVTLVCPPSSAGQPWLEDLPEAYQEVKVEVHDPNDRNRLSYLATTKQGRRVYLNRTVVDADQTVVVAGCRYDPILGYTDALTACYPSLSDQATRIEIFGRKPVKIPGEAPESLRQLLLEVAWLLGAPFLVQVVEGPGDQIADVVGGSIESVAEGQRLLDLRRRFEVERPADLVLATVVGDPARHDWNALAQALANAARVVEPGGQIILLTQVKPTLGPAFTLIRDAESTRAALDLLADQDLPDRAAARQWLQAAQQARTYVLLDMEREVGEELFVTPLDRPEQAQRLLNGAATCLLLPDADKTLALVAATTKNG